MASFRALVPTLGRLAIGLSVAACTSSERGEASPTASERPAAALAEPAVPSGPLASEPPPSSEPQAPAAAPVPAKIQLAQGWCVVIGSVPYEELDRALALAEKARVAGYETAGVFDPRDLQDLSYGMLVVIARSGLPTAARAEEMVGALEGAGMKAFARRCTPLSGLATAVASASELAPLPTEPVGPPVEWKAGQKLELGCFAWSKALGSAACVVGSSSSQPEDDELTLSFVGSELDDVELLKGESVFFDPTLSAELASKANELFRTHGYAALDLPTRPLVPGGKLASGRTLGWVTPPASVRWARGGGEPEDSTAWATEAVEIRCGERGKPYVTALEPSVYDDDGRDGSALHIPGTRWMLLTARPAWGMEGWVGERFDAALVDLETCEVSS